MSDFRMSDLKMSDFSLNLKCRIMSYCSDTFLKISYFSLDLNTEWFLLSNTNLLQQGSIFTACL